MVIHFGETYWRQRPVTHFWLTPDTSIFRGGPEVLTPHRSEKYWRQMSLFFYQSIYMQNDVPHTLIYTYVNTYVYRPPEVNPPSNMGLCPS